MGGNEAESRSLRDLPGENLNRDLQMRPLRGARTDESWIHPDELLVREASPDEFDLPAIMEAREHPEGYDLDQRLPDGTRPRDWLTQFNPVRANLPDISDDLVRQYVEENHEARPWLKAARDSPTEVSLVYVAVDRGVGHTLQRHEGFGDEELH